MAPGYAVKVILWGELGPAKRMLRRLAIAGCSAMAARSKVAAETALAGFVTAPVGLAAVQIPWLNMLSPSLPRLTLAVPAACSAAPPSLPPRIHYSYHNCFCLLRCHLSPLYFLCSRLILLQPTALLLQTSRVGAILPRILPCSRTCGGTCCCCGTCSFLCPSSC